MPTRRGKKIKWISLIVILILGLIETTYLAFEGEVGNNFHEIGCATYPPSLLIKGRVINAQTQQVITGASVTIQHLKRLNWTCEVYDERPPLLLKTDDLGAFIANFLVEQGVQAEISISAVGCQPLVETVTTDRFFSFRALPDSRPEFWPEFWLKCAS